MFMAAPSAVFGVSRPHGDKIAARYALTRNRERRVIAESLDTVKRQHVRYAIRDDDFPSLGSNRPVDRR